jgi:integrase
LPSINAVTRLDGFFKNMRAKNISTDVLNEFIAEQQKLGFAPGSINRSLAALRRMLKIAARDGKLNRVPHFPMLREAEPRAGFLEATDYHKLLAALPSHLRVVLGIGFWCGLRIGEIRSLRWSQIDFFERTLSLRALETKNNTARVVPLSAELLALLEAHRKACPPGFEFVAFQPGEKGTVERLRTFTRAWGRCCKQVGLEGRLFHDLRRSAVRNLTRAGVSQAVAMTISGHKTASVFRRYNIVDVKDLADAGKKLEVYLTAEAAKEISAKLVQNEVPAEEKKLLTN